jgi:uncharacterized protein YbaA (DUF1428 family)
MSMTRYVDGFLIPVPKGNMDAYKKIAEQASVIWKDHGALEYCAAVADDLEHEEVTSFRTSAGAKPDETVVFAWIVYASREHRDTVNAAVMADPRMAEMMSPDMQVFDCKRMAYGGFRMLVDS